MADNAHGTGRLSVHNVRVKQGATQAFLSEAKLQLINPLPHAPERKGALGGQRLLLLRS